MKPDRITTELNTVFTKSDSETKRQRLGVSGWMWRRYRWECMIEEYNIHAHPHSPVLFMLHDLMVCQIIYLLHIIELSIHFK